MWHGLIEGLKIRLYSDLSKVSAATSCLWPRHPYRREGHTCPLQADPPSASRLLFLSPVRVGLWLGLGLIRPHPERSLGPCLWPGRGLAVRVAVVGRAVGVIFVPSS